MSINNEDQIIFIDGSDSASETSTKGRQKQGDNVWRR